VSEYVAIDTPLDGEAKQRGYTIYLPHKSIPMLPRELSENICSLKEHEDRLAFVWKIRLHKRTGEPLRSELVEAIIRSRQKLTYEQVDTLFEGDSQAYSEIHKELLSPLFALHAITQKIRKKRLLGGYEFFNEENKLLLDEKTNLLCVLSSKETPSHGLIEECMLLANKESAKMLNGNGIFRIHEPPKEEKIDELLGDLRALGLRVRPQKELHALIESIQQEAEAHHIRNEVDRMIIRSQAQARYGYENIGHFGLGFEEYSHFTSPIRRYADLMLHRLLKAILKKQKNLAYLIGLCPLLCDSLSGLERESAKVEMDYKDRKYARWALANLGETIHCVITDTQSPPIVRAKTQIIGARIFLKRLDHDLFEEVRVQIVDVNLATARIYGKVVGRVQKRA